MNDLQLVAVPGIGSILGLRIKAASKARVCLVWGYVDPCDLGYMIERKRMQDFRRKAMSPIIRRGFPMLTPKRSFKRFKAEDMRLAIRQKEQSMKDQRWSKILELCEKAKSCHRG